MSCSSSSRRVDGQRPPSSKCRGRCVRPMDRFHSDAGEGQEVDGDKQDLQDANSRHGNTTQRYVVTSVGVGSAKLTVHVCCSTQVFAFIASSGAFHPLHVSLKHAAPTLFWDQTKATTYVLPMIQRLESKLTAYVRQTSSSPSPSPTPPVSWNPLKNSRSRLVFRLKPGSVDTALRC